MSTILTSRALSDLPVEGWGARLERLGQRAVALDASVPWPGNLLGVLGDLRVRVGAVMAPPQRDLTTLAGALLRRATQARSPRVLLSLGPAVDAAKRESTLTDCARLLHGLLGQGPTVLLAYADRTDALLDAEAAEWLLSDLPALGLAWDPSASWHHPARAHPEDPTRGIEGLAARIGALRVHGQGSDGRGGAHPEDLGAPWDTLVDLVPRGAPWILDLAAHLGDDGLLDAVQTIERGRGR